MLWDEGTREDSPCEEIMFILRAGPECCFGTRLGLMIDLVLACGRGNCGGVSGSGDLVELAETKLSVDDVDDDLLSRRGGSEFGRSFFATGSIKLARRGFGFDCLRGFTSGGLTMPT
jgi:hypothetical protein